MSEASSQAEKKPSVRSSAPTRLSSTMSEMRAVMIENTKACPQQTPPAVTAAATMSLLKYCFAVGGRPRIRIERHRGQRRPGADR